MEVEQLARALRDEHPQMVALAFLQLPPDLTGRALAALPAEIRADVAARMATTNRVDPAVSRALLVQLKERFGHLLPEEHPEKRPPPVGGAGHLAEMLKYLDPNAGKAIMDGMASRDAGAAERVRESVFVFEDVAKLSDRDVQRLWHEIDRSTAALALRDASAPTKEKLLRNVSQRVRAEIERDVEAIGPQPLSAIREAQAAVAALARRLMDAGEILAPGRDELR